MAKICIVAEEDEILALGDIVEIVVRKHFPVVKSLKMDVDDVKQELWIRLMESVPHHKSGGPASLRVYVQDAVQKRLFEMARQQSTFKRGKNYEEVSMEHELSEGFTVEETLASSSIRYEDDIISAIRVKDCIRKARAMLSPKERALFDSLLEGMSQREIAEQLGCTQPNVSLKVKDLREVLDWLREELAC